MDEVHCVEHWGLDFRPEYRLLSTCRALLGYRVPCGGFTATLTPEDQRAVTSLLGMTDVKIVQVSPDRPNIFVRCEPFDHLVDEPALFAPLIQELLQQVGRTHKLLIYVKDKTRAERYWHYLLEESVNACREYGALLVDLVSGDLSPEQVKAATDKFLDFQCLTRVLILPEVLGMGVDIKGLYRVWVIGQFGTLKEYVCLTSYTESYYRFVFTHVHLPMLHRISQLFGRCGRDGHPSEATLFIASDRSIFKCDASTREFCAARSCLRMMLATYFCPHMTRADIMTVSTGRDMRCCSFCVLASSSSDRKT